MSQTSKERDKDENEASLEAPSGSDKRLRTCIAEIVTAPPGSCLVQVSDRIRTTALCLNRYLQGQEQSLSRLIQDRCRGVVMADVLERLQVLGDKLQDSSQRPCYDAFRDELLGYVRYYSQNVVVMSKIMELVALGVWPFGEENGVEFFKPFFDPFLQATREHAIDLARHFFLLVGKLTTSASFFGRWNSQILELFLTSDAAFGLVLQVANDLPSYVATGYGDLLRFAVTLSNFINDLIRFARDTSAVARREWLINELEARLESLRMVFNRLFLFHAEDGVRRNITAEL
ncbi:hypothetical protein MPSEU_001081000 [Mayamaea pseudoterrestris]|nr:hypothetical protein MPSEU_001081000 [Mayamaea pseudoterrestris]